MFAADHLVVVVIGAIASLIAGTIADQIFEPAMQKEGSWMSAVYFSGSKPGDGIALLYGAVSLCTVLIGIGGFTMQWLQDVEEKGS